ncbi:hypothetical protein QYF61_010602 [Mycteria americana]|uniref:Uncharacterized protein n=1 Tax=Mycteria americana TaxID=33587 RepID=A0AAN7PIQ8_MYCAM|nr:hypothetical protein QYF61_010602 [Mycteria americana]
MAFSWLQGKAGGGLFSSTSTDQDHRIIESQNHLGWKRPLRSSSPTVNLTLPSPPLNHVPQHHIYTSFKYLQRWSLNHFPQQTVPMLDHHFSKETFPNIQSKPPLARVEAISSHPITRYLGEETNTHLTTPSFQVVVESNKVSPQPPLLQTKQTQFPQPLLIRLDFQRAIMPLNDLSAGKEACSMQVNQSHRSCVILYRAVKSMKAMDGDSTTSLGSLFQCLTTLSVKKFFLISNLNLPWHNLRPFPLVLSLVTWEKRPTPTSLQPTFRLNNPSSLSRSSQDLCSRPFTSFVGHTPAPQCLSCSEGPKTEHSI